MSTAGRVAAVGAAALLASTIWAVPAQALPARDAVKACKTSQQAGQLAATGVTFGKCVNLMKGPSSKRANNFVAAFCSVGANLTATGTTSKGQCIKVVKTRATKV